MSVPLKLSSGEIPLDFNLLYLENKGTNLSLNSLGTDTDQRRGEIPAGSRIFEVQFQVTSTILSLDTGKEMSWLRIPNCYGQVKTRFGVTSLRQES